MNLNLKLTYVVQSIMKSFKHSSQVQECQNSTWVQCFGAFSYFPASSMKTRVYSDRQNELSGFLHVYHTDHGSGTNQLSARKQLSLFPNYCLKVYSSSLLPLWSCWIKERTENLNSWYVFSLISALCLLKWNPWFVKLSENHSNHICNVTCQTLSTEESEIFTHVIQTTVQCSTVNQPHCCYHWKMHYSQ